MRIIYLFIILLYRIAISIATLFSSKAKLWVEGRKNWEKIIKNELEEISTQPIWMHVSSVGEFEQGVPVLESLNRDNPEIPIVLTFFSPSGYELLKDTKYADYVFYLPLDTPFNAKKFLNLVNPRAAIFVKYEFWFFYYNELNKRTIPFVMVSSALRKKQDLFQWYGKSFQRILFFPDFFFVQDKTTELLLNGIGQNNVMIVGDTRVDRVSGIVDMTKKDDFLESFRQDKNVLVLGSAWQTELKLITAIINEGKLTNWKFLIAPHEINEGKILTFIKGIKCDVVRYTKVKNDTNLSDTKVLVLDCMGVLKYAYRYSNLAIIGGGFGDGIHNILEPSVFGVPTLFGPKHEKFPEAKALIERGGSFEFKDKDELDLLLSKLTGDKEMLLNSSSSCIAFIDENRGATVRLMTKLKEVLHVE